MLDKSELDKLRQELILLHQLLAEGQEVNPETRDAMQAVAADIQAVLDPQSAEDDWSQIGKRWRDAILGFETRHPRLTQAVDQITGALANAGI